MFSLSLKSLINRFTIYQYMIFFLVVLNLASAFFYDFGVKALIQVLIVTIATMILDLLIEHFKSKSWLFPQSALISGLFIGGLLTQGLHWYIYVFAGAVAILSKHIIKFQQKHIFNPANFGILLASIFFGAAHTWWISSPLILVLIFGIFMIWRLKRFDLAVSFLIAYYFINSIIEFAKGGSLNDVYLTIINGGVVYFFSMFMLVEPKTHPTGKRQKIVYGILVAVLLVILTQYPLFYKNTISTFFTRNSIPLALAIGNMFVPILNKMKFDFVKKQNPETSL